MTDKTCGNCAYFHATDKDRQAGECHIYPPKKSIEGIPVWPKLDSLDWCGQFLSRQNLYEKKKKK